MAGNNIQTTTVRSMPAKKEPDQPDFETIRGALSSVLASRQFAKSPRASRFLRYVVDATLARHEMSLKEYTLGVEVFDRGASFNPQVDPIVRVEAVKLRKRLRNYYCGQGRTDSLIIELPRGTYRPTFRVRPPRRPRHAMSSVGPSLAVLPFVNLDGNTETAYFGDGLADEVSNALTRISGLKVIARSSAVACKAKYTDVREIGKVLGVAAILEGSVRRSGSRIRVMSRLVSTADRSQLWSQSYDREMDDVFAIQEEISQAIVNVLDVTLNRGATHQLIRCGTLNMEAYHAYLEGNYYFRQLTPAAMSKSRACHERAIQLDPKYALPQVGLAEYYFWLAFYLNVRPRKVLPHALAAAQRALDLDPASAEAYSIRGTIRAVYQYDWKAAGGDLSRSIQLNPTNALARYRYAYWYLCQMGRLEEASAESRRALDLDPLNLFLKASYAVNFEERTEKSIERARDLMQLFPGVWISCWMAGIVLAQQGLSNEAAAAFRKGLVIDSENPFLLAGMAVINALQGELTEAQRILRRLEKSAKSDYVSPAALELACVACGDVDRAFYWLDKGVTEHDPLTLNLYWRLLPGFKSDPRYSALLRKLNVAEYVQNR
jgi:serine/threonine-protein kinase